jgi:protein SCO1/2
VTYFSDISGQGLKNVYQLEDQQGVVRTAEDFKGKVVVLSFGYTFCPDVCPTTLADLASAMKLLGEKAADVQVLFVTVDPGRDTPSVLAQYVPAFSPAFIGLSGSENQVADVARNFKVYRALQGDAGGATYTVDHTAGSYVVDKAGQVRFFIKYGEKPDHIAQDLALLI